jgi:hypothetical protein
MALIREQYGEIAEQRVVAQIGFFFLCIIMAI